MTQKELTVIGLAVIVVGGLACAACARAGFNGGGTDDRPPIEVVEGTIRFKHEKEWRDTGNRKKFKSKQTNGRPVRSFDVTVSGELATCSAMNGTVAVVEHVVGGNRHRYWIYLERDGVGQPEPVVESSETLTVDSDGKTLVSGGSGEIAGLEVVGGNGSGICSFSEFAKPNITFTFRHP